MALLFVCANGCDVAGTVPPVEYVKPIGHEILDLVFSTATQETIVEVLNEVKKGTDDPKTLQYTVHAWNHRNDLHPMWKFDHFDEALIKINMADVIVQAIYNQELDLELYDFVAYARHVIHSDDAEVAGRAVLVLANARSNQDIPLILEVAISTADETVFHRAVIALSRLDRGQAEPAVQAIYDAVQSEERREYIKKLNWNKH